MKTPIPFGIKLRLRLNTWFIIGFSLFLVGIPIGAAFVSPRVLNDGKLNSVFLTTKGTLVDIVDTGLSSNEEEIWEFAYEYTTPDKERITSYSYAKGFYNLNVGDTVNVQYHPENFYLSRVEGMRTTEYGIFGIFSWLISFSGIIMTIVGWVISNKVLGILEYGRPAWGKLIEKKDTNVRVNEKPVYKLTYEFETEDRKIAKGSIKTHKTYMVTDEAYERLLYFPSKPRQILLLDNQKKAVKKFMKDNFSEFSKPKKN